MHQAALGTAGMGLSSSTFGSSPVVISIVPGLAAIQSGEPQAQCSIVMATATPCA